MRFVWGITRSWTATIPSFVSEHQTPADVPSPSSSRPAMWTRTTRHEDDDFTAGRILADKPEPGTPGGRLYKVRWKGFTASRDLWEPRSSFVPRYTTVWMEYPKKKNISLDVKDVLVHLLAAVAP